jgi:hypothetical protein
MPGRPGAVGRKSFFRAANLELAATVKRPRNRTRERQSHIRHIPGQLRKDLPSLAGVTEGRLRTKNPCIHAVVALPSLVAVQMSTTRSQLLKFLQDGPPPGQGTTLPFGDTGYSQRVNLLAAKLSVCLTLPPVKVLPSRFSSRVIHSPEKVCSVTLVRGLCCAAGDLSDPSGIVGASQNVPPDEAGTCHTSTDVNKRH